MFLLPGQSAVPQPFAHILPRECIICQDPFIKVMYRHTNNKMWSLKIKLLLIPRSDALAIVSCTGGGAAPRVAAQCEQ